MENSIVSANQLESFQKQQLKKDQLKKILLEKSDESILESLLKLPEDLANSTPYQRAVIKTMGDYTKNIFFPEYPQGHPARAERVVRLKELYIAIELSRLTEDDRILEQVVNKQATDNNFKSIGYKKRMNELRTAVYKQAYTLKDGNGSLQQLLNLLQEVATENKEAYAANAKLRSVVVEAKSSIASLENEIQQMQQELAALKNGQANNKINDTLPRNNN